ncbi:hypothetical protein [Natronobacterium gregoryi]|nr:hypothetical protein [Natronobacterium gregoryi]AFZ71280.1 hypothetical protein Natgr_0006 [Natronobacterium gregoryi SP2]PLK19863.1 hypothetical protein CYV19_12690 [Natronobacterium gregoryi SP2]SFJ39401.1 hypothetical protein SAMN05443661_12633 [Natronobacterium gregoryi]
MNSQNRSKRDATSTMRDAVKRVLFRGDDVTTIEECRRCGKSIEAHDVDCPSCGCADIVEYRIR